MTITAISPALELEATIQNPANKNSKNMQQVLQNEQDAQDKDNIIVLENCADKTPPSRIENAALLKNKKQVKLASKAKKAEVSSLAFMQEQAHHEALIENLNAKAFGPARFTRAAHFIREDGGHDIKASFVVEDLGILVASIRMTPIKIATIDAHLLGPLVVEEKYKGTGLGRALITMAINAVKAQNCCLIILVGDAPYYSRFGFTQIAYGQMQMPAPVDPQRLLALELQEGCLIQATGLVKHKKRSKIL